MSVQGPFQSHILGGAQQISFVGISKAANPPCPCSASYSLTHFTAWVNSDSRARLPPLPWSHQPPKPSLCPLPKPTLLTTAPSSGEVCLGREHLWSRRVWGCSEPAHLCCAHSCPRNRGCAAHGGSAGDTGEGRGCTPGRGRRLGKGLCLWSECGSLVQETQGCSSRGAQGTPASWGAQG